MAKVKWTGISLYAVIAAMLLTISLLVGCSSKASISQPTEAKKKPPELNIAAAISLKDTLKELAAGFEKKENVKIVFNFASSGDLMTQIEQGAPTDIFISAGKNQMDSLEQEGIIDKNSRFNLIGNDLVVVVPQTSKLSISKIEDLAFASGVEKIANQKRLAAKFEDYLKSDMALDKFEASGFKPVVKKIE